MKVFKSEKARQKVYESYNRLLEQWGVEVKEHDIGTSYGSTHVITCGNDSNPPLVLFHGVGDNSAIMWIYNVKELTKHFHIFAVDTIGGPGKSCPNDNYNKSFDQIKWIDEIFGELKIDKAYIAGVSNGSYITQHLGIERPEKVIKMICMSGSIFTVGSTHPIKLMLKAFLPEALLLTKKNIKKLLTKLAGENSNVFTDNAAIMEHFTYLAKGFNNRSMAYHKIEFFEDNQISRLYGKCLFLLGEEDPLVDMDEVKKELGKHKLEYQIYKGVGHGINHEISEKINQRIIEYFN